MTNTKTETTKTFLMTDRPPVSIREDQWPVVVEGEEDWYNSLRNGGHDATREVHVHIGLRKHEDGRVLAYGSYQYITLWQDERNFRHRVGRLFGDANAPIANAGNIDPTEIIKQIGRDLIERVQEDGMEHVSNAVRDAIDHLPPEEI
ncbi:MAG: hypothetical protein C5B60_07515 [Chloroflexi bacterium]|nr:MAG: hypothetical protein C5B60_07515 [Chloroflexota bacterium]